VPLLRSTLIPDGFHHGFTTRAIDPDEAVAGSGLRLFRAHQVHGADVIEVHAADDPAAVRSRPADVLTTAAAGLVVAVATADCVPILLCHPGGACAAVHAGWRGTVARAVHAAVTALTTRHGVAAGELRAVIGPCICPTCYEVGDDVAAQLGPIDPHAVRRTADGRAHLDLRRANRSLLLQAGLRPERIGDVAGCTRCDPGQRFHSYRRDREARGSQLAFIGRPA
jgi:YfiH family protein